MLILLQWNMTVYLKVNIKYTYGNKARVLRSHRAVGNAEYIPIWIAT